MEDALKNHEVSDRDFIARVIEPSARAPVLVDFWAPWCGPCRMLAPMLSKLVEQYGGDFTLAKVNTDQEPRLAQRYGIRALPTVKMFKHGKVVDEFTGVLPESAVRAFIERHVERPVDKVIRQAQASLEAGDAEQALRLLEQAARIEPDNPSTRVETARVLMHTGALDEAQAMLNGLPLGTGMSPDAKRLQAQLDFARSAADGADDGDLERSLASDPDDLQARYRLSARKVVRGQYEEALELLLEIMRRDRRFGDDAGRRGILSVFEILGGRGGLVSRYRAKMVTLLH